MLSVNGIFWCLISTGVFFFFFLDGWRGVQQMFRSSLCIIKSGPTATEGPPIKTPSGPRWPPDDQTSTRPLSHPLAHTTKQPITFVFSFALTKQNLCREMLPDLWLARRGILWGTPADGGVGMWINRLAGRLTDGIYGRSRRQRINFFEGNTPQPGSFVLAGNLALSSSPGAQLTSDSGNVESRKRLGWELHCVIATDVCGSDERWGFLLFVFKGWAWVLKGGTKRQEVALLYRLCRAVTQGTCITLQCFFFSAGPFALSNFAHINLASKNRFIFAYDASVVGLKSNKKKNIFRFNTKGIGFKQNVILLGNAGGRIMWTWHRQIIFNSPETGGGGGGEHLCISVTLDKQSRQAPPFESNQNHELYDTRPPLC